jgi:hypothetical protein
MNRGKCPAMTKPKDAEPTQSEKFKALARVVEADMSADAFDGLLKGTRGTKPPTKEEAFEAKRKGETS